MRTRSRRWFWATVLVALTLIAATIGYVLWSPVSRWVPGTYVGTGLDGRSTVVTRFDPDGTWTEEVSTPDAPFPATTTRGRWRVSGRVLILETGAAASAPAGFVESVTDRFRAPLLGNEVSRVRVVSADETGLMLHVGNDVDTGAEMTRHLDRRPGGP